MSEKSPPAPSGPGSSAVDSRARISASQAREPGSTAHDRASGPSSLASFAIYDRGSCLWRTSQLSLVEGLGVYSETWPRSGSMRGGIAFPLRPLAPLTVEIGSTWSRGEYPTPTAATYGSSQNEGKVPHKRPTAGTPSLYGWAKRWPTPLTQDGQKGDRSAASARAELIRRGGSADLPIAVHAMGWPHGRPGPMTCTHGGECRPTLNPRFVEWLMGLPLGWTEIDDAA